MTYDNLIILCRTTDFDDERTHHGMRRFVLPSLREEATELKACRKQCEPREDWLDDWVAAGMLTEEVTLLQAIAHAEKRLAEFDRPRQGVVTISFDYQESRELMS